MARLVADSISPTFPSAPSIYPHLSGRLGSFKKAAATQAKNEAPANAQILQLSPPANSLSGMLSQRTLSQEDITRHTRDVAVTQVTPQVDKPRPFRNKLKSKIRRALLRKWILKLILGKDLGRWAYSCIRSKALIEGFSTN